MKLAELKENQSVHIRYRGRGCFHTDNFLVAFTGEDLRHPLIAAPELPDVEAHTEVSSEDVTSLDRLFEYWRQTQSERSPAGTSDCDIQLRWSNGETEQYSEEFEHAFPPPHLVQEYQRFVFGIMMGTVRRRQHEVAELKRKAFSEWALENHPLTEVRFEDDSTLYVLLKPDRPTGLDVRGLARSLSQACCEQTNVKRISCHVYDGKKRLVSETFKVRDRSRLAQADDALSFIGYGLLFGLVVVVGFVIWLLWWPINRVRRLILNSGT